MRYALWIPSLMVLSFALGMMLESARASIADKDETRVTGIGGIFFKAREPRELADWYRQHLGIDLKSTGSSETSAQYHAFEWRQKGDPGKIGSTVFSIFSDKTKYFEPSSSSFMINYRVASLDRILRQLKKEGVAVDDKIDDEPNDRFGWAMDPEGNRLELWQPKNQ